MKIDTKFNVGDRIFAIQDEKIIYFVVGKVSAVYNQDIFSNKYKIHIYYATKEKMFDIFDEQDCFATKEEAQKECDKRNGSGR